MPRQGRGNATMFMTFGLIDDISSAPSGAVVVWVRGPVAASA